MLQDGAVRTINAVRGAAPRRAAPLLQLCFSVHEPWSLRAER